MTDYPTIRIKCDPACMVLATWSAYHALVTYQDGQEGKISLDSPPRNRVFHVKRTKTGVTVRQIEGRAV